MLNFGTFSTEGETLSLPDDTGAFVEVTKVNFSDFLGAGEVTLACVYID